MLTPDTLHHVSSEGRCASNGHAATFEYGMQIAPARIFAGGANDRPRRTISWYRERTQLAYGANLYHRRLNNTERGEEAKVAYYATQGC